MQSYSRQFMSGSQPLQKGSMMIIETLERDERVRKAELSEKLRELKFLKDTHHVSANDEEIGQLTNELKRIKPSMVYIPGEVTEHERHAITGTKWVTAEKPKTQRAYPRVSAATVSKLSCLLWLIIISSGIVPELVVGLTGYAFIAVFSIIGIAHEKDFLNNAIHNYRIKRTNVDGIVAYELNGRMTNGLRFGLNEGNWDRLLEGLKTRDSELMPIFTKFCEAQTKLIELDNTAYKVFNNETTDENAACLEEITEMDLTLNRRTITEINEIFNRRDGVAIEAAKRTKDAAEHEAFVQAIQGTMDDKLTVKLQMQYVKDAYNL